jgi:hypothetical protein
MDRSSLPRAGAPEQSGLLQDGRTYLNTANVVDRLIRDFTIDLMDEVGKPGFMARMDFECRRMNNLFLGITPSSEYMVSDWNTPDQLGEYILQAMRINDETRLGVRAAFAWYFEQVLDAWTPGAAFDPEKVKPIIDFMRNALLGLLKPNDRFTVQ